MPSYVVNLSSPSPLHLSFAPPTKEIKQMHPTSPPHFIILNLKEFCYLCKIPIVLTLFLLKISSILMTKQHKSLFVSIALAVTSLSISLNTSAQQPANAAVPFTLSGQIQGAAEGDRRYNKRLTRGIDGGKTTQEKKV